MAKQDSHPHHSPSRLPELRDFSFPEHTAFVESQYKGSGLERFTTYGDRPFFQDIDWEREQFEKVRNLNLVLPDGWRVKIIGFLGAGEDRKVVRVRPYSAGQLVEGAERDLAIKISQTVNQGCDVIDSADIPEWIQIERDLSDSPFAPRFEVVRNPDYPDFVMINRIRRFKREEFVYEVLKKILSDEPPSSLLHIQYPLAKDYFSVDIPGADGKYFFLIVMDVIKGPTVDDWINTHFTEELDTRALLQVLHSIASGMNLLIEHGIYMRDAHTRNFIVHRIKEDGKTRRVASFIDIQTVDIPELQRIQTRESGFSWDVNSSYQHSEAALDELVVRDFAIKYLGIGARVFRELETPLPNSVIELLKMQERVQDGTEKVTFAELTAFLGEQLAKLEKADEA